MARSHATFVDTPPRATLKSLARRAFSLIYAARRAPPGRRISAHADRSPLTKIQLAATYVLSPYAPRPSERRRKTRLIRLRDLIPRKRRGDS